MLTASDLNLDENDSGITFTGTYRPGTKIKYEFEDGDSVILKKGEINIEIIEARKQVSGKFTGTIKFVRPDKSLENKAAKEGVEISFDYNHIFECSRT